MVSKISVFFLLILFFFVAKKSIARECLLKFQTQFKTKYGDSETLKCFLGGYPAFLSKIVNDNNNNRDDDADDTQ
jgi:hypothetical protein